MFAQAEHPAPSVVDGSLQLLLRPLGSSIRWQIRDERARGGRVKAAGLFPSVLGLRVGGRTVAGSMARYTFMVAARPPLDRRSIAARSPHDRRW